MIKMKEAAGSDWVAALVPPLLIACVMGLFNGAYGASASRRVVASRPSEHREVANVAAMATRDYFTATQDKNPMMALVHVTSASALLSAARRIGDDEQLSLSLSTDVRTIASDIDELQRKITARLGKARHNATKPRA